MRVLAALAVLCAAHWGTSVAGADELIVSPPVVAIRAPEAAQQLLVTWQTAAGRLDVTRTATRTWEGPAVASIDSLGRLVPVAEGTSLLALTYEGRTVRLPIEVSGLLAPPPVSFAHEIVPLLTKARCNSGGCHGKAEGQNGFRLSVLGFDPAADYDALVKQSHGRRIRVAQPELSLLLQKATADVPHGGGLKIEAQSPGYRRLLRWIREGAAFTDDPGRQVVTLELEPSEIVLSPQGSQQLRVTAVTAAGERFCATAEAGFETNAGWIAEVSPEGLVRATDTPGEAAILVRYEGHVAVCRVTLPRADVHFARPPVVNFIDELVWDKLARLGIEPSPGADEFVWVRRVYLDTIGRLPTAEEVRAYAADGQPDRRGRLIDQLLARPEYADYWAMKWADILRADKLKVTPQGAVGMTRWLRRQFAENRPYDEMVREILTARGPIQAEAPTAFFKAVDQPEVASRSFSQLFLGVRIECAQCHHHPSERWGQDDYAGLAGFFTGLKLKAQPDGTESLLVVAGTDLPHPRTQEIVPARALGAAPAEFAPAADRRAALAAWLTADDNPFFARAIANRLWAHYFGRGLIEPIDDIRATNPPSNEPLMLALEQHLREVDYDLRAFTKTLLSSQAYQLSSETTAHNADDVQNFSHALVKSLPAEVLLDAICQATGVPEKFNGWPLGVRAVQVWDNRMPSYFFRIFGRPVRASVCECERSGEPSIAQALHLLNSPELQEKLQATGGRARQLAAGGLSPDEVIDELFLAALSRWPTTEERDLLRTAFTGATRAQAAEDVLWAILNTKEFLFVH